MKNKIAILVFLLATIIIRDTQAQDRKDDYEEFEYNFKRALASFSVLDFSENQSLIESIKNINDLEERKKKYYAAMNDIIKKYLSISTHVQSVFNEEREKYGFGYKNKYLLEDLSNTEYPIITMHTKLMNDGRLSNYSPREQTHYAIVYLLLSLKYLDLTDNYNFTTTIILRRSINELRAFSFDQIDDYLF